MADPPQPPRRGAGRPGDPGRSGSRNPAPPGAPQGSLDPQDAAFIRQGFQAAMESFESRVSDVNSSLAEIRGDVEALDKTMRGSADHPDNGLVQKVALLGQQQAQIIADIKEVKAQYNKLIWWIIGLLVSIVGSLAVTFVVARSGH